MLKRKFSTGRGAQVILGRRGKKGRLWEVKIWTTRWTGLDTVCESGVWRVCASKSGIGLDLGLVMGFEDLYDVIIYYI